MARVVSVEGETRTPLVDGWQCASTGPGAATHPDEIGEAEWIAAVVPGTVALALTRGKRFDYERDTIDFDATDWWYRRTLEPHESATLRFDGLATIADVWVNGKHVLRSENMYIAHAVALGDALTNGGRLAIRFASLTEAMKVRRPRPRWRTKVVRDQQLRFFRTTLLGRIPSWAPPVAPVGPYRPVTLIASGALRVRAADVRTSHDAVDADVLLEATEPIASVTLHVGDLAQKLSIETHDGSTRARGRLSAALALWWPHTHGTPHLHRVKVVVQTTVREVSVDLGQTGFRSVAVDRQGGGFALRINGERIFCRGAVFTPLDPVGLQNAEVGLRAALEQVREAGMNVIRIGGTAVYESDDLYAMCDELGILVWQDLMFANMDYPTTDETFARSVRDEVVQALDRLQLSPSLVVVCGGSETEQQAAMVGLPPAEWSSPMFAEEIPKLVSQRCDAVYIPATPTEGALPFDVDTGVAHYYGVGGYLRPLEDARRANVRFAAECLGFSNVPSDENIEALLADGEVPTTHPRWKARIPRDRGTAWDFEDVRDHYTRLLFGVDPTMLRRDDLVRYLELSRVATAEVMARTMTEWRRPLSTCAGALVWMLRDFWLGAGWGVVDALGKPKAAYYALKRTQSPIALLATDEGHSGVALHAMNDGPVALVAHVRVALFRGAVCVGEGEEQVTLPPRTSRTLKAEALLGRFCDSAYAYRFGPPGHDVVFASLTSRERVVARAFHFPMGMPTHREDLGVSATFTTDGAARRVTIRAKKLACAIAIDARGFVADDAFFHIEPGGERVITLLPTGSATTALSARVLPINATMATKVIAAPT